MTDWADLSLEQASSSASSPTRSSLSPDKKLQEGQQYANRLRTEALPDRHLQCRQWERRLSGEQQRMIQHRLELQAAKQRLDVERAELDQERRSFLLCRVHASDDDVMRRERDLLIQCRELETIKQ